MWCDTVTLTLTEDYIPGRPLRVKGIDLDGGRLILPDGAPSGMTGADTDGSGLAAMRPAETAPTELLVTLPPDAGPAERLIFDADSFTGASLTISSIFTIDGAGPKSVPTLIMKGELKGTLSVRVAPTTAATQPATATRPAPKP